MKRRYRLGIRSFVNGSLHNAGAIVALEESMASPHMELVDAGDAGGQIPAPYETPELLALSGVSDAVVSVSDLTFHPSLLDAPAAEDTDAAEK